MVFIPLLTFWSCDPNEDLYNELDDLQPPYNESIDYTLVEADYSRFEGFIEEYEAFSDSFPAMDYVPDVLKVRFVTLKEESRANVTYNYFLEHPDWWDSGFGYELTDADYEGMNISDFYFTPENPAQDHVPSFLAKLFLDSAEEGDVFNVAYNYLIDGEQTLNLDVYEYNGEEWIWLETTFNIPYVGYELTLEDYESLGGMVARFGNFSESDSPELYLPAFLSNFLPYAVEGQEQVVKYKYHDGNQMTEIIDKYEFDGIEWHKVPYIEERTEQYVYGSLGWAFDPTVIFTMDRNDYMYLVEIDPIGQQELPYDDFGYYYGASGFYSNFDIRLIGRRLDELSTGEYADPELGLIYEEQGDEAAMEEMLRRITHEGIPALLQHKFPNATPQVGGIDVHYLVNFQTFADNWVRDYPVAEYICVSAGSPPVFQLVEE